MDGIDPATLTGSGPQWRMAWEETLSAERARVQACVREGTAMTDPKLQPFVVGYLARARRGLHSKVALNVTWVVLLAVVVLATRTIYWPVFFAVMLVLVLVISPWQIRKEFLALDRAANAQRPSRDERRGEAQ